jgi:transcriptional regulator GlxA family with amidase domain
VNAYRVEEAKQLMQAHPEMKMAEVASRSGFASQAVFSQVFSKETGISPLKWNKERISGIDDIL